MWGKVKRCGGGGQGDQVHSNIGSVECFWSGREENSHGSSITALGICFEKLRVSFSKYHIANYPLFHLCKVESPLLPSFCPAARKMKSTHFLLHKEKLETGSCSKASPWVLDQVTVQDWSDCILQSRTNKVFRAVPSCVSKYHAPHSPNI